MKVKFNHDSEETEQKYVFITIGTTKYRISETIENRIVINKTSEIGDDYMRVFPMSGNVVEIN